MLHPYLFLLFKSLIGLKFGRNANEKLSAAEIKEIAEATKLSTRTVERMFGPEQESKFWTSTLDLVVVQYLKSDYGYISWNDFEKKEIEHFSSPVERKPYLKLSKQEQQLIDKNISDRLMELEKKRTGTCLVSIYHFQLLRTAVSYLKTKQIRCSLNNPVVEDLSRELGVELQDLLSFFTNSSIPSKFKLSLLNSLVVYCSSLWSYRDWDGFEHEIIPNVLLPYKTGMPALETEMQETLVVFVEKRMQELILVKPKTCKNLCSARYRYSVALVLILFTLFVGGVALSQLSGGGGQISIESPSFLIGEKKNLKVDYEVPSLNGNWCIKNYGSWNPAVKQFDFRKLVDPVGACNFYCNKPGTYNLLLLKNGKMVSEIPYYVNTKCWYAIYKGNKDSDVLPDTCGRESMFMKNGVLKAPESEDVVWANFYYIRDMGIDAKNFILEAKVRNTSMKEYDSRVWVFGEKSSKIAANFVSKGATEYGYIYTGDSVKRSGENFGDLSDFQIDLSTWRIVRIAVKKGLINFFVDGHKVGIDYPCSMPMTRLRGIVLTFKGHGECDYVKVLDVTGRKTLFCEGFDRN